MKRRLLQWKPLFLLLLIHSAGLFAQTRYYVDKNVAAGTNNGLSWETAFEEVQQALATAASGDTIWVAKGTYFPTSTLDRSLSFELINGVKLYGGFCGVETSFSERDYLANPTILSGDIGIENDTVDNSFSVVYTRFADTTTVLDGFEITGGNARISNVIPPFFGRERNGGGLYIDGFGGSASPKISHCKFIENFASGRGGAIYIYGRGISSTSPLITSCNFYNNSAASGGGAVFKDGGSTDPTIPHRIKDCLFENNHSVASGGAFYYNDTHGTVDFEITACTFLANTSETVGGGFFYLQQTPSGTDFKFTNSAFEANTANRGGAVTIFGSGTYPLKNFTFRECDFIANEASGDGGALMAGGISSSSTQENIIFTQCNFEENYAKNAGALSLLAVGNVLIDNTNFKNNRSLNDAGAIHGSKVLEIRNCKFIENWAMERTGGAVTLPQGLGGHQLISNCLFLKNNAFEAGAIFSSFSNENLTIVNSVFWENTAHQAGAIDGNKIKIYNTIFWGNKAEEGDIFLPSDKNIELNYCLLDVDSCSAIDNIDTVAVYDFVDSMLVVVGYNERVGSFSCSEGMVYNLYPMFRDTTAGDFSLLNCSPAINAGNNAILNEFEITSDLAANPRILDGIVDLGVFESAAFEVAIVEVMAVSCAGGSDGSVSFDIQNGCEPFTMGWSTDTLNGSGTEELPGGAFSFTITDAVGKQAVLGLEIPEPPPLSLTTSGVPVNCEDGTTGIASVLPSGGAPPYTYLWENQQTDSILQNLSAGLYGVTVTDSNNCAESEVVEIDTEGRLELSINVTPISCHDSGDGTVAITPLNGISPFHFIWQDGQVDSLLTGLSGGSYSVTVTDSNGCADVLDFSIAAPDSLDLNISAADVLCHGDNNGSASVIANGGTEPYSYWWSNFQTQPFINNLSPGEYSLTVTDANNCSEIGSVTINEASLIQINFELTNAHPPVADGAISITQITGGTSPYSFLWNTGDTTQSVEKLPPGNYTLTLTDANGCEQLFSFTIDIQTTTLGPSLPNTESFIFPNPTEVSGMAYLHFHSAGSQPWELYIFDVRGKVILHKKQNFRGGSTIYPLDTPAFSGFYFILLENDRGLQKTFKWLVL